MDKTILFPHLILACVIVFCGCHGSMNRFTFSNESNRSVVLTDNETVSLSLMVDISSNTTETLTVIMTYETPENNTIELTRNSYTWMEGDEGSGTQYLDFSLSSSMFPNYGQYSAKLSANILNSSSSEEISITCIIVYEESLSKINMECARFLPFNNEPVEFFASVTNGDTVEVLWTWNATCQDKSVINTLNVSTIRCSVTGIGEMNVTVTARNPVSERTTSCSVTLLYPLQGFLITPKAPYFQTTEPAVFFVNGTLPEENAFGEVTLLLSANGTQSSGYLVNTTIMEEDLLNQIIVQHEFKSQGFYRVFGELISPINTLLLETTVGIWDKLDEIEIAVSETTITYGDPVAVWWVSTPQSHFNFIIWYGDDTVENKTTSTYDQPFEGTNFTKIFQKAGRLKILLTAWNEVYLKNCTIFVNVEKPISLNDLICKRFISVDLENVNFTAFVDQGADIGVEWEWNVNNTTNRTVKTTVNYSVFEYNSNTPGDINITVLARNLISQRSSTCLATVLLPLKGFFLHPSDLYFQTTEPATFSLNTSSEEQYPAGIRSLILYSNYTGLNIIKNETNLSDAEIRDGYHFDYVFEVQGYYKIWGNLTSEIDTKYFEVEVSVWDKLDAMNFSTSVTYLALLDAISLVFVFTPPSFFNYNISLGDGNFYQNASDSFVEKYNDINVTHHYTATGIYNITMYAWNGLYSTNLSSLVYVDEEIRNIEIKCQRFVSVELGRINFTAVVYEGGDIRMEWEWNVNNIHRTVKTTVNYSVFEYNITTPGDINITILARNTISQRSSTCLATVLLPLKGFFLHPSNSYFQTTEPATFSLNTSSEEQYPAGIRSLILYSNYTGLNIIKNETNLSDAEIRDGYHFDYEFEVQGYYKIWGNLTSEIDTKYFEVEVSVWDKLDAMNFSTSVTYLALLDTISLVFVFTPPSFFNYNISLGDGNFYQNASDSFVEKYNDINVTHHYTATGIYNVTMHAWNGLYSTNLSSVVYVDEEIRNIEIKCQRFVSVELGRINFTAVVYEGGDVRMEWEWNVNNIHRTVKTTVNYSVFEYNSTTPGDINITILARNTISERSSTCIATVLLPLKGFFLHPSNSYFQTTEPATFSLNTSSEEQYPAGIRSLILYSNYTGLNIIKNETNLSDAEIRDGYHFDYEFEVQGYYKIWGNLTSEIDTKYFEVEVSVWDKLDAMNFSTSLTYLDLLDAISLVFVFTPPSFFNYNISLGDGNFYQNASDSFVEKYNDINVTHHYTATGIYNVTMHAWNDLYSTNLSSVVYVDEEIRNIEIICQRFVSVELGRINFTVVVYEGSDIRMEWEWNVNNIHRTVKTMVNYSVFEYNITTPGDINITVLARNTISQRSSTCLATVLLPLKGFFLHPSNSYFPTTEPATFSLNTSSEEQYPAGIRSLILYSNYTGHSIIKNETNLSDAEIRNGYQFVYAFEIQGYYKVWGNLISEIDTKYLEVEFGIWDKLDVLNFSTPVTYIHLPEALSLVFVSTPASFFNYKISLGDGNFHHNTSDSFVEKYNDINVTHHYTATGTYTVTMYAWNELYSTNISSVVYVEEKIRNVQIACQRFISVHLGRVNITAFVDRGEDIGIEWQWSVNDIHRTLRTTVNYTVFEYGITNPGDINTTVVAKNFISQVSSTFMATVLADLDGFFLQPSNTYFQTSERATISLNTSAKEQYPAGIRSLILYSNYTGHSIIKNETNLSDAEIRNEYQFEHVFEIQGYYKIWGNLTSEIDTKFLEVEVGIWDKLDVLNFSTPVTYIHLPEALSLVFVSTPASFFNYRISLGDGNFRENTSDSFVEKYNDINVTHQYTATGIYTVTMYAWNELYSANISSFVYVEEKIGNVQIACQRFISVHLGRVNFTAFVDRGADIGIEWQWSVNDIHRTLRTTVNDTVFEYDITNLGDINITVVAKNFISQNSSTCIATVLADLDGFFLQPSNPYFQTSERATFSPNTSTKEQYPAGIRSLILYSNYTGHSIIKYDTNLSDAEIRNGYHFEYVFEIQGYYKIWGNLTSEIYTKYLEVEVGIWDKLDVLNFSTPVTYIHLPEALSLAFVSTPASFFNYRISLGDGNFHENTSDSFVEKYNDINVTHHYTVTGIYTVTMYAWNELYSTNISSLVYVEEKIRNVQIMCQRFVSVHLEPREISFTAFVDQGADIGIDWQWNVNDNHQHLRTMVNYSDFEYRITTPEDINIAVLARNFISQKSSTCITTVLADLNDFFLQPLIPYFQTTEPAIFSLNTTSKEQYPAGIRSLVIFANDTDATMLFNETNLNDTKVQSGYQFQHLFQIQGSYKVWGSLTSEIDSKFLEVVVGVWDIFDELNFTTSSTYVVTFDSLVLSFICTPPSYFNYNISFGDGSYFENSSNAYTEKHIARKFHNEYSEVGVYGISVFIWNELYSKNLSADVFVEKRISNLEITCSPDYMEIGTSVNFWATIDNGATHKITWTLLLEDSNETQSASTPKTVETYHFSYLLNRSGDANFTIMAENRVSNISKSCIGRAVYRVHGYLFNTNASTYETTENIVFFIKPKPQTLYPQDVGSVNLFPDDWTKIPSHIQLNSSDQMIQSGIEFPIQYSFQGSNNVCTEVVSRINSVLYCTDIEIWDKLDSLTLVESYHAIKVNESVNIKMKGFPRSNFNFMIWYGDGRYFNRTTNAYTKAFNESDHELAYSEPGLYTIIVEAWNKLYTTNLSCSVLVEHPLIAPQMNLYPETFRVPIPDGWVVFTVIHPEREPLPSNVKCYIDFDEERSARTEIAFTSTSNLSLIYQFKLPGKKNVQLMCNNSVSKRTLLSNIDVVDFNMNDIKLEFINPTVMNITRSPVNPFKVDPVPTYVTFHVALLNCMRLPHNLTETWDFGDGTDLTMRNNTEMTRKHQYHTRETFNVTVNFTLDGKESFTYRTSIRTGLVDVSCTEPMKAFQTQVFVVSLKMFGKAIFQFNTDSGEVKFDTSYSEPTNITTGVASFTYTAYGYYMPKIIGQNEFWVEEVYLSTHLTAEFDLTGALDLRTGIENDRNYLELPPGRLLFAVQLASHIDDNLYRPLVSCVLVSGDEIDRSSYTTKGNITANNSLLFDYTYQDLGNQSVNVRCSNFISETFLQTNVRTFNDYFGEEGMFDRTYSSSDETMLIYESEAVYISNRMSVKYSQSDVFFQWQTYSGGGSLNCYDFKDHRSGTCLFNEDESNKAGEYRITLNVSIPAVQTYMVEHIYIEVVESEPFVYVEGGMSKVVPVNQHVQLSAKLFHFENSSNLDFNWESESLGIQETGPQIPCMITTPGIYDVTLIVSKNGRKSNFTQSLIADVGMENTLFIRCVVNCMPLTRGISPQTKMALTYHCENCPTTNGTSMVQWSLFTSAEEINLDNSTITMGDKLVLRENTLKADTEYTLVVTPPSWSIVSPEGLVMKFRTSAPPSAGFCNATYNEDEVAITATCSGWRNGWGETVPLSYQYETITRRRSSFNTTGNIVNYLYRGFERSVFELHIQVGDPWDSYCVRFRIKIYDRYGDHGLFEKIFTVIPPSSHVPTNQDDTVKINNLLEDFRNKSRNIRSGGDIIRIARYIGSVASMITDYSNTIPATSDDDIMHGRTTTVELHTETKVEKLYKSVVFEMLGVMLEETSNCRNWNEAYKVYSLADLQTVFSAIDSLVRFPRYLDFDTLETAVNLFLEVSYCYTERMKRTESPLPNHYIDNINDILIHFVRITSNLLEVMVPHTVQNLDEPLTNRSVLTEVIEKIGTDEQKSSLLKNMTGDNLYGPWKERVNLLMVLRQHERSIQLKQRNITRKYLQRMQDMIMSVQESTLPMLVTGERLEYDERHFTLVIEKTTIQKFADAHLENGTDDVKNSYFYGLRKKNGTFDNPNALINVMIIIYGRNPYIFGANANSLTSEIYVYHFGSQKQQEYNDYEIELSLRNNVSMISKHEVSIFGSQVVNFEFSIGHEDDYVIIFLEPMDTIPETSNPPLFEVYVSHDQYPSPMTYSPSKDFLEFSHIRNWEENFGYKIFVRPGICLKGTCYLGVKQLTDDENHMVEKVDCNIRIITTSCRSWNRHSQSWEGSGCTVLPMSTMQSTVCRCSGETFSSTFIVPFNKIDFAKVWGKFDPENAAVYGTLIILLVIYVIVLCFLRREDKKDVDKWRISFLCDNDPEDDYFYMITVHTGLRPQAGTTSNMYFVLTGSEDDSGIRILSDGGQPKCTTGSICTFIFSTKSCLGDLLLLRIWHDNSGTGNLQDWYIGKVEINDLQNKERYVFLCNKWLSLYKDDGLIDRQLPISTSEGMTSFGNLVSHHLELGATENHVWLSLLLRPRKSPFTRVQRLSCLLALLFLTMLSNAMFYKSPSEDTSHSYVNIGFIKLSPAIVYVSVMSIVITTIPILLVAYLFRQRKVKKQKIPETRFDVVIDDKMECPDECIKEDEKLLPYWMVYVSWALVLVIILGSVFLLLLFSMEWGKEKSVEWLLSFLFSFVESLLLVDPLKVLVIAVLFSTIFKQIIADKPCDIHISKLKAYTAACKNSGRKIFSAFAYKLLSNSKPLAQKEIEKLREQQNQEKRVKKAISSLILHTVYMVAIYAISFSERDPMSFIYKESVDNHMNTGKFHSITDSSAFLGWLSNTFIPVLYPETDFANNAIGIVEKQWFGDHASIRVGPAQLRQLRVMKEPCSYWGLTTPYPCINGYTIDDSDTEEYCLEWKKLTPSCAKIRNRNGFTSNAWKYTHAEEIWGTSQIGEHGTYDGGGYLLKFTKNRYQANELLDEIEKQRWIDRGTRAVFIEFTLYNPNSNLFIYSRYLAEFLETGGVLMSVDSSSFRSIVSTDMVGGFIILCYLIFIVYILGSLFKLLSKIKRGGCRQFIKVTWNCVNVLLVVFGLITIVFYVVRLTFTKMAMQLFYDDKLTTDNKFINFNHIVIWDYAVNSVFSLVVFVSTLRFLKLLGYNKRFTQITSVVSKAGNELCSFSIIFVAAFLGFASLGTLMLGKVLREYNTFLYTCGTLSNSFIGKNKLNAMVIAAPLFAYAFFLTYTVFVIMILISVCAAILNSSISNVKATVHQETNKFGISHVLKRMICDLLRIRDEKKTKSAKEQTTPDVLKTFVGETFSALNLIRLLRGSLHNELADTSILPRENRDMKCTNRKNPPLSRSTHLQNMRRSVFPFEMNENVVNINEISVQDENNMDVLFDRDQRSSTIKFWS